MKHLISVAILSLFFINLSNAQWCERPDPDFCPNNRFTNGNFESISGDPQASIDRDINLANGWGSIFTNGLGPSNADIACAGTALCGSGIPTPNNGGVFAGMWIQNSGTGSNSTYREQMYNILSSPIAANTGFYSFTCRLAATCQSSTSDNVDIAVYGVYNPSNTLATNAYTSLYAPADNALWAGGSGVQVVLLGTISTPPGIGLTWQNVSFTFNSNVLPAAGITHIMITRGPTPSATYKRKFIMFDDFCMQTTVPDPEVPTRGCCDNLKNENLIMSGSFEAGNIGFTTGSYTYQGTFSQGSIKEGMYSVVSTSEATKVSNCWNILDHTYCSDGKGHFMVVNGRTHNPQSAIVYEQKEIKVEKGEEYMFCMYYQHLPQCSFDVFDPRNLHVGISEAEIKENECESDKENCGWTKISYTVIPQTSTLNIQVFLDEGGIGDGNDVAFDDFTLRKKEAMPSNYCGFDVSSSTSGSNITLTATALTNPLPSGFNVTWNVTEANCSTWAPIAGTSMSYGGWNPYNTNFPGYCCVPGSGTPGQFSTSKCYIITRTATNCCYKDCKYQYYLSAQPQGMIQSRNKQSGDNDEPQFYISTDLQNWEPLPLKVDIGGINGLKIYPNPGDGKVTISAAQSLAGAHLTVYNAEGKIVMDKDLQKENNSTVDLSALPNGAYSFKISTSDNNSISKTYIKQ